MLGLSLVLNDSWVALACGWWVRLVWARTFLIVPEQPRLAVKNQTRS
eukprot:CAMPEP_0183306616 /NCGR_PEP_ID=MMETSP0160_2-20130417/13211_1 /TAXON_ID=2839 ORGANISM="Odontella Sinensis, Strain Grunow 1884" /NCGR_SAMPLE_ID=MMETSP0160_2 /ASSEMBLY_ACC=CAM_ASM_000250 /LENGTH=46 /DNA_ID= /DNA_START= /DNA_END= /DNA_ORIENTATION=